MDLATHFRVIAQNWLRILLISIVLAIVVFLGSSLRADTFQAKQTISFTPGSVEGGQTEQQAASFLAQSYAKFVDTAPYLTGVIRRSKLNLTLSEVASRISASPAGDLGFLDVKATGPNRAEAERLGNAAGAQLVELVTNVGEQKVSDIVTPIRARRTTLQQELAQVPAGSSDAISLQVQITNLDNAEAAALGTPTDRANVLGSAVAGKTPVSPKPLRDAILGFLVALVVVSELTVLAHFTGDRFSGTEDSAEVAAITGLPILAKVPKGEGIEVVEAFRVLRTNLMVLEGAGKPRTVAIVSANQGAGKTFTAVHLAESASALDEKVVLVDADLRKPTVHERLGVPRAPGLSSVLQGGDLTAALTKVADNAYLRVLPSGAPVQDASGVLGARSFRHVLDALRAVRLVIVDTPPSNLFADAMAVASQCDATIFVLDVKTSRQRAVRQALESLDRAGANLIGVIINRATVQKTASYYES
ncbi:MAG: polysaccharide biosynthesis tyrosine autokinase [Acidimicrobiia bacterium]